MRCWKRLIILVIGAVLSLTLAASRAQASWAIGGWVRDGKILVIEKRGYPIYFYYRYPFCYSFYGGYHYRRVYPRTYVVFEGRIRPAFFVPGWLWCNPLSWQPYWVIVVDKVKVKEGEEKEVGKEEEKGKIYKKDTGKVKEEEVSKEKKVKEGEKKEVEKEEEEDKGETSKSNK